MHNLSDTIYLDPRKTFMEIMKVHTHEVPFANLLAFFLRPGEKHGMGLLFINSLLENLAPPQSFQVIDPNVVEVKVEVLTKNNNRIDILIIAEGFIICIEFKINHELNNPLLDYKRFIEENYAEKHHYFVVLTPYRKNSSRDTEGAGFKQIILSHFFKSIEINLSDYHLNNGTHLFLQYYEDLVQTVKNRTIRSLRFRALSDLHLSLSFYCSKFHNNNTGGFLELKKEHFRVKIRIKNDGWHIEKWTNNNHFQEILIVIDKSLNFLEIEKNIKRSLQTLESA